MLDTKNRGLLHADESVEPIEENVTLLGERPEQWEAVTLGRLIQDRRLLIQNGYAQGTFNDQGHGVIQLRPYNVSEGGRLTLSQMKHVEAPPATSPYWVRQGDVVFNNTNSEELVGKTAFFPLDGEFVLSNHMTILRVLDPGVLDSYWLAHAMQHLWYRGVFQALCRRHVNQASVSLERLRGVQILLPPLREQQSIAYTLRVLRDGIGARHQEAGHEREFKAALMQHLFTHGTCDEPRKHTDIGEMPQSWEVERVGDVAEVAYGLTVNATRRNATQSAPYLTVANVTRGALRLDEVKEIGVVAGDTKRYRVCRGDVLLVEGNGNPKLLGSAAVWKDELPLVLHQNHLIRARPNQTRVLPDWLMHYLNSDVGRAQLLGQSKTSSGLHTINSRIVSNLHIPLPPPDEQGTVVRVMQACDDKLTALEREISILDELFRAMLEELMTGRLSTLPIIQVAV